MLGKVYEIETKQENLFPQKEIKAYLRYFSIVKTCQFEVRRLFDI